MAYYPEAASVPASLQQEDFVLRPLSVTYVALDYDALMSSKEILRRWSQSDWPTDDFSLEDNLKDLERHEQEHKQRVAFTYTVLAPGEKKCVGCVYFEPLSPSLEEVNVCGMGEDRAQRYATHVGFWVRASEIEQELDAKLLAGLREWLKAEWVFDCVVFQISEKDERQIKIMQQAGLKMICELHERGKKWLVFG